MPTEPVEVLDKTPNASVVKLPWRQFPGVVLQGDTLRAIFGDLIEMQQIIDGTGPDAPELEDVLTGLLERFHGLLGHYEAVLDQNGQGLPYSPRWFAPSNAPPSPGTRTPPWVEYPDHEVGSVFWKMGGGEEYLDGWLDWFTSLPADQQDALQNGTTTPYRWRALLEHVRALK